MLASPTVQVVLSHCGSGIVSEALYFSKPLVCLPVLADQVWAGVSAGSVCMLVWLSCTFVEPGLVSARARRWSLCECLWTICHLCPQLDVAARVVELGLGVSIPLSKRCVRLPPPRPFPTPSSASVLACVAVLLCAVCTCGPNAAGGLVGVPSLKVKELSNALRTVGAGMEFSSKATSYQLLARSGVRSLAIPEAGKLVVRMLPSLARMTVVVWFPLVASPVIRRAWPVPWRLW